MMCPKYLHVRETFLSPRFEALIPSFTELSDSEIMPFLLGEDDNTAALAAKYVFTIHSLDSTWFTWYWPTWSFHYLEWFWFLFIIYVVIYLPMLLLYILYILMLWHIVLRSHANKAHLNWIEWIEIELRARECERERERGEREREIERERRGAVCERGESRKIPQKKDFSCLTFFHNFSFGVTYLFKLISVALEKYTGHFYK